MPDSRKNSRTQEDLLGESHQKLPQDTLHKRLSGSKPRLPDLRKNSRPQEDPLGERSFGAGWRLGVCGAISRGCPPDVSQGPGHDDKKTKPRHHVKTYCKPRHHFITALEETVTVKRFQFLSDPGQSFLNRFWNKISPLKSVKPATLTML